MYGWLRKGSCIGLVLVLVCSLSLPALAGSSQPEGISAASAVLISADTGSVLYEKEAEKKLSMASTTKIMTALLALEEAEKEGDPTVTVTEE
ncbi:MAG: D-alanyl-D-alanine carboxypeptidase, partial [Eubacteriales bacterium]